MSNLRRILSGRKRHESLEPGTRRRNPSAGALLTHIRDAEPDASSDKYWPDYADLADLAFRLQAISTFFRPALILNAPQLFAGLILEEGHVLRAANLTPRRFWYISNKPQDSRPSLREFTATSLSFHYSAPATLLNQQAVSNARAAVLGREKSLQVSVRFARCILRQSALFSICQGIHGLGA
jgi:hypothetical protein